MAKKKNTRAFMQLPLPSARKYSKMVKRVWTGLNKRQTIDTGDLSMEENVSTLETPYLVPSQKRISILDEYAHPISMFGFDDFLLVIYRSGTSIHVDYIIYDADEDEYTTYTGVLKATGASKADEYPRSVVQFNVYDTPTDPVEGSFIKKLLIFPDRVSMDFHIDKDNFPIDDMTVLVKTYENEEPPYQPPDTVSHNYFYKNIAKEAQEAAKKENPLYDEAVYHWVDDESDKEKSGWKLCVPPHVPPIKYATVFLSRLFGVDDDRVYASGYNDYTNWNLDTVGEYNESNAWVTPAQSNTRAGGVFTGITTFQSHVICFKQDFMHELYNTKNPFRLQDVFAEGTIDNRTIQDVDGRLIFVSSDNVKIYTGANPRIIGYPLGIDVFREAVSGTDGRCYYLYCIDGEGEKHLFVYDTYTDQWSEERVPGTVLSFAHNKNGMYMLLSSGKIYKLDTGSYDHDWCFETDLITAETIDIKHIKKIQLFADFKEDAKLRIYILYGDKQESQPVYEGSGEGHKTIRIKPRKTAGYGFKIRMEGEGYVKLYALELFIESGGKLYAE